MGLRVLQGPKGTCHSRLLDVIPPASFHTLTSRYWTRSALGFGARSIEAGLADFAPAVCLLPGPEDSLRRSLGSLQPFETVPHANRNDTLLSRWIDAQTWQYGTFSSTVSAGYLRLRKTPPLDPAAVILHVHHGLAHVADHRIKRPPDDWFSFSASFVGLLNIATAFGGFLFSGLAQRRWKFQYYVLPLGRDRKSVV